MPSYSDLDKDQRAIYSESPMCGSLLVTGPPGTGKTVVAFHRAITLQRLDGQQSTMVVFGKVLRHYVSTLEYKETKKNISILHFDKWFPKWFKNSFDRRHPLPSDGRFARDTDWDKAIEILDAASIDQVKRAHWGHLIVDEGQDLPVGFYRFASKVLKRTEKINDKCPTLSVYADDNQTITEQHSSVREIKREIRAKRTDKRFWKLFRNYRNSYPVAKFAQHFQLLKLGAAKLPVNEAGRKPDVIFQDNWEMIAKQIVNLASSNTGSTGVVFFGNNRQMFAFFSILKKECLALSISSPVLYQSGQDENKLDFSDGGPISVLNVQSVKGLEFDNVIVMNWEKIWGDHLSEEAIKQFYVVSSRTRSALMFMLPVKSEALPNQLGMLPHPDNELAVFRDLTGWKDSLSARLKQVDWTSCDRDMDKQRAFALAKEIISFEHDISALINELLDTERFPANQKQIFKEVLSKKDIDGLATVIIDIGPRLVDKVLNQDFSEA